MQIDSESIRKAELEEYSTSVSVRLFQDIPEDSAGPPSYFGEARDHFRRRLYDYAWSACEARMQAILARQHSKALKEITSFIFKSKEEPASLVDIPLSKSVPTALVVGADHATSRVLSTALAERATEKGEVLFARLDSREAGTVKAAFRSLIARVIAAGSTGSNAPPKFAGRKPSMLQPDDMLVLQTWYQQRYTDPEMSPVVAIFLDDFEGYSPHVVADLVYILSMYRARIPFCLVLGISTSVEVIQRNFLRSTMLYIRPSTFALGSSHDSFNAVIEGIFLSWDRLPLDLNADVFALVKMAFEDLNLSLDNVVSKVQYMYLHHMLTSPYAAFALLDYEVPPGEEEEPPDVPDTERWDVLLTCPSLHNLDAVPHVDTAHLERCLASESAIEELVHASACERRAQQLRRSTAWELINILEDTWQQGRVPKSELLRGFFDKSLATEIERLCRNLQSTSQDVLLAFLRSVEDGLREHDEQYENWLIDLESRMERTASGVQMRNGNVLGSKAVTEDDEWFTMTIREIAALTETIIKDGLVNCPEIRFTEIWTFTDARLLQSAFHPSIRGSLVHDADEAYERLQDAGKLVNLADWYHSLGDSREISTFIRDVSGLAWQGWIVPTKRKTEHVARAAW